MFLICLSISLTGDAATSINPASQPSTIPYLEYYHGAKLSLDQTMKDSKTLAETNVLSVKCETYHPILKTHFSHRIE